MFFTKFVLMPGSKTIKTVLIAETKWLKRGWTSCSIRNLWKSSALEILNYPRLIRTKVYPATLIQLITSRISWTPLTGIPPFLSSPKFLISTVWRLVKTLTKVRTAAISRTKFRTIISVLKISHLTLVFIISVKTHPIQSINSLRSHLKTDNNSISQINSLSLSN